MKPSLKNPVWFEAWGWTYRPVSTAGWLLVAIALLFLAQVLVGAFLAYRSLGAIVFVTFPYVVSCGTLLNWIASKTAAK